MAEDQDTPTSDEEPDLLSDKDLENVTGGFGPMQVNPQLGEAGILGEAI